MGPSTVIAKTWDDLTCVGTDESPSDYKCYQQKRGHKAIEISVKNGSISALEHDRKNSATGTIESEGTALVFNRPVGSCTKMN